MPYLSVAERGYTSEFDLLENFRSHDAEGIKIHT